MSLKAITQSHETRLQAVEKWQKEAAPITDQVHGIFTYVQTTTRLIKWIGIPASAIIAILRIVEMVL